MFSMINCATNAKVAVVVENLHLSSAQMLLVFSTIASSAGLQSTVALEENSTSLLSRRAQIGPELCLLDGARRAQASKKRDQTDAQKLAYIKTLKIGAEITNSSQDGSLPPVGTPTLVRVVRATKPNMQYRRYLTWKIKVKTKSMSVVRISM